MQYKLAELIDVEKTEVILGRIIDAFGASAGIIDLEGNVIVAVRWRKICTDFHRKNQVSRKRCIVSTTKLANEVAPGGSFSVFKCLNGLTGASSPIVIEGEHLGNAFICQFLTEKPDTDFFTGQADEHEFDKSSYLSALSELPIIGRGALPSLLPLITSIAEAIASVGLRQLRQMEVEKELHRVRDKLQLQNAELKASEEELRAQNEKLYLSRNELLRAKQEWERTFDAVPDLIAILDPQHRIVRANREMARRIGLETEQCAGLLCHECVHDSSSAPAICPHQLTLLDGREHIAEVHEPHLGGHFLVSTTALRDERGDIVGTVHVARDITGRKRMEEELRKSRDELEARVEERTAELGKAVARLELSNQELQEFAFVASHDLQEPLRKIHSFCDLVMRSNLDRVDEKGVDYLTRMQQAAKRMQRFLKDLLNYSRVSTQPEPFQPVDIKEVATEAAELFEHKLSKIGGKIEMAEMPVIQADPGQMIRLFQNLIGNAVKYASTEKLHIRIYSEQQKSLCRIFVEDNGIGFDERYLDRIFSPFQRLHGRSEYSGTGMGLAICRKIAERHLGSITAKSAPGKGSTFIVTLPVKQ
ncbi:putative Histidine kinase [Syntrophobacter sp. SbD1]|nr:putative Histidine kinase [Syntrophobacter sp. SbD1]